MTQISLASADDICTYKTYAWNTQTRSVGNIEAIRKPYSELTQMEVDAFTGCSVCEQDQRLIKLPGLKPFKACHLLAKPLEKILIRLIQQGEMLNLVVGYRVGKTRGNIDQYGYRTGFSNHSFGIAFDINSAHNGLYDNCLSFSKNCRLIRGGHWREDDKASLQADGAVVQALARFGLKWGGQIAGRQKDFMHFSPGGY